MFNTPASRGCFGVCPDCGKHISVFGESKIDEVAAKHGIPVLAKLPIRPDIASLCDEGRIAAIDLKEMDEAVGAVENV